MYSTLPPKFKFFPYVKMRLAFYTFQLLLLFIMKIVHKVHTQLKKITVTWYRETE